MSMVKTGTAEGKVKKVTSDEELDEFEKKSAAIRHGMEKKAEKVKHDPTKVN